MAEVPHDRARERVDLLPEPVAASAIAWSSDVFAVPFSPIRTVHIRGSLLCLKSSKRLRTRFMRFDARA